MKKFLMTAAFVLTLGVLSFAQFGGPTVSGLKFIAPVFDQTLNDENALILIKYVGTSAFATIDLNGSAIELHIGAATPAAATDEAAGDVNVGDVCGSTASALDVTDAECDTFGELVRVINANSSDHGWIAVLVGALPTESIAAATDFIDMADTDAKREGGYAILPDSSVHDEIPGLFAPWVGTTFVRNTVQGKLSIEPFLARRAGFQSQVLKGNPVPGDYLPMLQYYWANQNSAGAGTFDVYSLVYDNEDGTPTATLVFETALADDTDLTANVALRSAPIIGQPGSILFIRADAASAGTLTDTDDQLDFFGYYAQLVR
jgi:hypothetical protein